MVQSRLNTFGSLIETGDMPTMIANLFNPGRMVGCDFGVAGVDLVSVAPGSALLPNGVLVIEDEVKNLVVSNSSFAADYTVVYQLEDTLVLGGSPALLRLLAGISSQDDFTDAVILGWIRYPGGSIPLSSTHFIQPASLRVASTASDYYYSMTSGFSDAKRPATEKPGAVAVQQADSTNVGVSSSRTFSFGGQRVRILGGQLLTGTTIVANVTNYMQYQLKKGSTVLYQYDTRAVPTGQGTITANIPANLVKQSAAYTAFIIEPNEVLTLQQIETGIVADNPGAFSISYEAPASSGNWVETQTTLSNEIVSSWLNVGTLASTYALSLPFPVAKAGQPSKVVARLQVDFNCIVTFSIKIGADTVTLLPNTGIVSNTGTLITREFDVPATTGIDWTPAASASVEILINAQPGRGMSLAQVSLLQESSPFQLFIS